MLHRRLAFATAVLLLTLLSLAGRTLAQVPEEAPLDAVALDSAAVARFADAFFAAHMDSLRAPGAVFTVVRDSQVVFSKGYGMANVKRGIPVDPETTRFRLASVALPFTATAAMQLVETGRLDLHTDVNAYLDRVAIPDTFDEPVTPAHLLAHTSGFEETLIGFLQPRHQGGRETLADYLQRQLPARVRPPGQWAHHVHYESALAEHLVARQSGTAYPAYVQEHILGPLGMTRTGFGIAPEDSSTQAQPYVWTPQGYRAPRTSIPPGMVSTGADMGRFMIAHLQQGRYRDARILQEATARRMHAQQGVNHPELPGWTYGFQEDYENGFRLIGHKGAVPGSHRSVMKLIPAEGVGFFTAFNSAVFIEETLTDAFMDRFFLARDTLREATAPQVEAPDLADLTGSYRSLSVPVTTSGKLVALFGYGRETDVRADEAGNLQVGGAPIEHKQGLVFRVAEDDEQVAFLMGEDGAARAITNGGSVYLKVSEFESRPVHLGLVIVCMGLFLTAIVGWPVGALVRRFRPADRSANRSTHRPFSARRARLLAGAVAACFVAFLVLYNLPLALNGPTAILLGMHPLAKAALVLPLAATVLSIGLLYYTVQAWRQPLYGLLGRLHYTLVVLAVVVYIGHLYYWNLLGFHY